MNESVIIIQNLERENNRLKQDKQELSADLDAVKLEKKHLQNLLDTEIEDKKRLTDRINSFTIIGGYIKSYIFHSKIYQSNFFSVGFSVKI